MSQRHFNIAGPCLADIHYMLPPERRLEGVRALVAERGYFVLHAPRQIGKTTGLRSLAARLTAEGDVAAVMVSVEVGAAFSRVGQAERAILASWRQAAAAQLSPELQPPPWPKADAGARIEAALGAWAQACPRPLVVFIDEIDALTDAVLMSVLRQLRSGHPARPVRFPASIALVGLRDVRDYKAGSGNSGRLGSASPFNIKSASLTMRDFTEAEVAELYGQHTQDTGQAFDGESVSHAYELTKGQPWLVNALAREAVKLSSGAQTITRGVIEQARRILVARQDTHLDSLAERLREPRVRAVIEPILSGGTLPDLLPDDLLFVRDLGLVRSSEAGGLLIANPIYAEVIPRVLAMGPRDSLPATVASWRRVDGSLDIDQLLAAFMDFWRQHGQPLLASAPYHEVAPQLVFLALLDRVANGGGYISREYAIGSGRIDVMLEYGPPGRRERFAFELKVHRDDGPDPQLQGLAQLDGYLSGMGLSTGWLVIFDRRSGLPALSDRVSVAAAVTPSGRSVQVVRG